MHTEGPAQFSVDSLSSTEASGSVPLQGEKKPLNPDQQLIQALHGAFARAKAAVAVISTEIGPITILRKESVPRDERDYGRIELDLNSHFNPDGTGIEPFPSGLRQSFNLKMFAPHVVRVMSGFWKSQTDAYPVNEGDVEDQEEAVFAAVRAFAANPDSNQVQWHSADQATSIEEAEAAK